LEESSDATDDALRQLTAEKEVSVLKQQAIVEANRKFMELQEKVRAIQESAKICRQERDKMEKQLKDLQVENCTLRTRLEHREVAESEKPQGGESSAKGNSTPMVALEEAIRTLTIGLEEVQKEKEQEEDLTNSLRMAIWQ